MEVLARRLLTVAASLDRVITCSNSSILNFDVRRWMCELAFSIWSGAFIALELSTHLELEPTRVLHIEEIIDVDHCHIGHPRAHHSGTVGGAVRSSCCRGRRIQWAGDGRLLQESLSLSKKADSTIFQLLGFANWKHEERTADSSTAQQR